MLFLSLGPSSLPIVLAQPDERYAHRTVSVLEWYDGYRMQHLVQTNKTDKTYQHRLHYCKLTKQSFILLNVARKSSEEI